MGVGFINQNVIFPICFCDERNLFARWPVTLEGPVQGGETNATGPALEWVTLKPWKAGELAD